MITEKQKDIYLTAKELVGRYPIDFQEAFEILKIIELENIRKQLALIKMILKAEDKKATFEKIKIVQNFVYLKSKQY